MSGPFQAIIIGAGQAGLAAAHELVLRGLVPGVDFLVLDAEEGPGGAWRHRWDSLVLGRAHGIADLPGLPLAHQRSQTPASVVVSEYYGAYEEQFGLHVLRPVQVESVRQEGEVLWISGVQDGQERVFAARYVLSATGTWTRPYVPHVRGIEGFRGAQLHTVHYRDKQDFQSLKTLVVGGGLSAVQFLLELAEVTETVWATRRPPNFTDRGFTPDWGRDVEHAVQERTLAGQAPASVVRTTGIPLWEDYVEGVQRGVLVSRGMFEQAQAHAVVFPGAAADAEDEGLGPSASAGLVLPQSWQPFPAGHVEEVDVIFWNTGFRPALNHLRPLRLREPGGGIRMLDEVTPARNQRIYLLGYASTASTLGANRAGRLAGRKVAQLLGA